MKENQEENFKVSIEENMRKSQHNSRSLKEQIKQYFRKLGKKKDKLKKIRNNSENNFRRMKEKLIKIRSRCYRRFPLCDFIDIFGGDSCVEFSPLVLLGSEILVVFL